MNAQTRRAILLQEITQSNQPIAAGKLAKQLGVSRQLVVGDVALLRAQGHEIIATPRGYQVYGEQSHQGILKKIAVEHQPNDVKTEILTIVDLGGTLLDVIVDHPLYGELRAALHIASRYDAQQFFHQLETSRAKALSQLTDGVHLHTLRVPDEECYQRIVQALREQGFLYEKE